MKKVILLRARHQLTEGFFSIGSKGKAFDESDFIFCQQGSRQQEGESECFHGWIPVSVDDAASITLEASFYCKDSVN
ncbi:hypothetical protein [Prosthecobacter vanneervenii]|uniref:Uncharacterized protein n=1 Tax=Prosthecobacter vanneervenii TaxID=48466 RepID=A0A7W7Y9X6_9BACT|nr:hypothetical protein [Prosthecobacter vanneervenii]MBB5032323.1 hypothetical protein [Prosthecobacter vanneervenii]